MMCPHWEFTLGAERVQEIVEKDFAGKLDFLAQNVHTRDFEDQVFKPYSMRTINGVPVAVIGQAFPYTPIANPRHMVPDWTFGIKDEHMQKVVDEVRGKGAQVVVVISHNGMDVDIKMASRVRGIDAILGGHTHDGMPAPVKVKNSGGVTLVTNAGSNSKFLGVLDFDVRGGKIQDFRYRLLPVFANMLEADPEMDAYITKVREPYKAKLDEKLAVSEGLLYRRGNFNGSWDQLIVDALMEVRGADMALSPGFRWGTTILPGQAITRDHLMDQVAITYPTSTLTNMTGATIKTVLEDIADNLFNPDPYYQQGGDMVRVGGLEYTCNPKATSGNRISDMRLNGKLIDADKAYKVAGWAPVAENPQGPAIWDVMETYFKAHPVITPRKINTPKVVNMVGNPGIA
jgi:sulfur-oxidizing protein SoxB